MCCPEVCVWRQTTDGGQSQIENLDLSRTPYVSYGVKYIGLVSLGVNYGQPISNYYIAPLFFKTVQNLDLDLGCVLISDPGTLGC